MVKLHFFDAEPVEREIPDRPWRAIVIAVVAVTASLTLGYELFWRSKGLAPGDYNNTAGLWAEARRHATGDATVIVGSSRIFFGTNLDVWEEVSGVRPVQLALEGTSPRIFLSDLANDKDFRGLVIVGVTVPLFFTSDGGKRGEFLKRYKSETLSQRADHQLMKRLEQVFAFVDEQSRPKRQVAIWPLPYREGMLPRFDPRKLQTLGPDRASAMWSRVENDDHYREEAKAQWAIGLQRLAPPPGPDGKPPPMPDAAINSVISEVKANVDKIRARGGDVAFTRFPYGGVYTPAEDFGFPRERFWDRLVNETNSAGIEWHDYPALRSFDLPEWSHLSANDAKLYTKALVPILYAEIEEASGRSGKREQD